MGRNAPEELKGRNVPEESDSLIQPPVKQLRRKSAKLWTVLVWLALWQGASMLFAQELLLPSPVTAFRRLAELLLTDTFRQSVVHSSGRILGGFTLGCFSGIACAIPAGMFPWFRELLTPPVTVIRAVPVASFVILSMVWLNARTLVVFIAFIMTFPPVYLGVCEGIAQTDQNLLEMARIFHVPIPVHIPYTAVSAHSGFGIHGSLLEGGYGGGSDWFTPCVTRGTALLCKSVLSDSGFIRVDSGYHRSVSVF